MNKFTRWMAGLIVCITTALLADNSVAVRLVGKVSDESGRPLLGANVLINRVSGAPIEGDIATLKATTGTNGTFDLQLRLRPTKSAEVTCELWFDHRGLVRAEKVLRLPSNSNVTEIVNVVLHPGEVLSGVIRSDSLAKARGNRASGQEVPPEIFTVSSGDEERAFAAGKDGAFEIYLPRGEYRFKVLSGQPFEVSGIKSGTTNLVITAQPFEWSAESGGKVFDELWQTMDSQYSYFFLKTNVDWRALRDEYRPQAIQAKDAAELAKVLQRMLAPLRDLHVWIETPGGRIGTYTNSYTFNGNGKVTQQAIE